MLFVGLFMFVLCLLVGGLCMAVNEFVIRQPVFALV